MVDEFDVAQALRGGIPDRARAWAFVRDFAAAWAEPLADGAGTRAEELERAEEMLGLTLPTALREAYSLHGTRHDLTGNQDSLLRPSELFVHDEFGGVLVFRSENQGCAFWGVRLRDLGQDDPPVFVQSRDGWVRYLERVSLACRARTQRDAAWQRRTARQRLRTSRQPDSRAAESVRAGGVSRVPDVDGEGRVTRVLVFRAGEALAARRTE
ncbi:hypothetical protein ACJ6WF_19265 [Streptomyces sp. MMS24-I2-30]|uniref:hypothetical protein n=1 Tax=Streptomyces sp. MMS24-I2-30 TaxID=3351564 RepID=UPI0038968FC0